MYTRYDFIFHAKGEAYCNSWVASLLWNGWTEYRLRAVSYFSYRKWGHAYPVSMEKPRDARLVSRVFAAPRSQSWAKTRHVTSDAIQEVQWISRLSKHIYLRGKDLFINLWIDASPIWNEMYLKKVVCNTKHGFALRLRALMLIMII